MAEKLVIVESPSKSKTIEQYLGEKFVVKSSKGHIRDLAISGPGGLGVDIANDFSASYKVLPDKKTVIKEINQALKSVSEVYLATDPDREGEAISWHLLETLDMKDKYIKRVIFNEITKDAILEAFDHPKDIDMDLVASQETRRIIDRIMGFKLSKLLYSKIKSKSAGRVQSAALKLIVDREKEIEAFVIEEYYEIFANFANFDAKLAKYKGKTAKIPSKTIADQIIDSLGTEYIVSSIETKQKTVFSKPPYITSTLQQDASNRFNYSSSKTMQIAQRLYEGIQIGSESVGLISYMRTDSIRLSESFTKQSMAFIGSHFGKEYIGHAQKKSNKHIQDAHEAIRPTDAFRTPESIKHYLTKEEFHIYQLIYNRAISSLMKPSLRNQTTILIENNDCLFRLTGSVMTFDGYLKLYGKEDQGDEDELKVLPTLTQNQVLNAQGVTPKQLFTTPPPRFNEARLIKEMEDLGIGRPSTYAQTIQTLKLRKYVSYTEKKFKPTEQGRNTTDKLDEFFPEFISAGYSREMEEKLDLIASGNETQLHAIQSFYDHFIPKVEEALHGMEKEAPKETGEVCPLCGSAMVYRNGKYGQFEACSDFPKCKYIKPNETKTQSEVLDSEITCPECKKGTLVRRLAKKGKNKGNYFLACNNFPKCKYISPLKLTNELCPECNKPLIVGENHTHYCIDKEKCGYHIHIEPINE